MKTNGQLTVYRSCVPVIDAQYESDDDATITEVLAEALAEAEGGTPFDLSPLYDVVDLDALSQLIDADDGTAGEEALYGFAFGDWNVFVRSDGRIRVCDGSRATDPSPVFGDGGQ